MQPNYDRFFLSIQVVLVIPASLAIVFLSSRITKRPLRFVGMLAIILLHSYATLEVRHAHAYITRDATFDHRYEEIAEIFHSIPNHEAITLAWGDAGKLPYYSGMKHIDVVGLNTNAIAHAKNVDQVLDYLSNARPDILIIPTVTGSGDSDSCAAIIRWGHGLIGHSYPRLASYGAFGEYELLASMPQSVYHLNLLVDPKSPHFEDIKRTILPLIGKNPIVRPAPHCMK